MVEKSVTNADPRTKNATNLNTATTSPDWVRVLRNERKQKAASEEKKNFGGISNKVRHGLPLPRRGRAPTRVSASARTWGQKVKLGAIDHPQWPAAEGILFSFFRQASENLNFG